MLSILVNTAKRRYIGFYGCTIFDYLIRGKNDKANIDIDNTNYNYCHSLASWQ